MTVISQPRYLPALNYLQRLCASEVFIVLDTVQRQSRGFENRNKLVVDGTPNWLTIPISSSSRALISNTAIKSDEWISEHLARITSSYRDCLHFDEKFLISFFNDIKNSMALSNGSFTQAILSSYHTTFSYLNIPLPEIKLASDIEAGSDAPVKGPEKLFWLCQKTRAKLYVSGPNGASYNIAKYFNSNTIPCLYHHFDHPQYHQHQLDEFEPYLGFLDALFNLGPEWLSAIIQQDPNLSSK